MKIRGGVVEVNLEIYRRISELFSTIDDAVEYIGEQTQEGNLDICVTLLQDIKMGIEEIDNSLAIVLERLDKHSTLEVKPSELTYQLDRIEQAYGSANIDVINLMIEESLKPNIQSWRRDIIGIVGSEISV